MHACAHMVRETAQFTETAERRRPRGTRVPGSSRLSVARLAPPFSSSATTSGHASVCCSAGTPTSLNTAEAPTHSLGSQPPRSRALASLTEHKRHRRSLKGVGLMELINPQSTSHYGCSASVQQVLMVSRCGAGRRTSIRRWCAWIRAGRWVR